MLHEKTAFFKRVKHKVKTSNNTRAYFKAVASLINGDEEKPTWTINEMFPDLPDGDIAERVACYFNAISGEYSPLEEPSPPHNSSNICPSLPEIAARLKQMKKPQSQVPGDLPPKLVAKYSELLAIPLSFVFEKAFEKSTWPSLWKSETVTVIPKCPRPTNLSQLRNLSCTPLFSKTMESFILEKLKSEVSLDLTQFGGIRGSSVDHFLIETWDEILRGLEDNRAAVALSSIDFEEAFNRVCHHQCLKAAEEMGASRDTLAMIHAFLTARTMCLKINRKKSEPKSVAGGSSQGSLLDNFLFCIVINQLNDCIYNINQHNSTPTIEMNGNNASDPDSTDDDLRLSPIARPDSRLTELNSDEEEEEIRASNYIYFNPQNRWYDTDISIRAGQNTLNEEFGLPTGCASENICGRSECCRKDQ